MLGALEILETPVEAVVAGAGGLCFISPAQGFVKAGLPAEAAAARVQQEIRGLGEDLILAPAVLPAELVLREHLETQV